MARFALGTMTAQRRTEAQSASPWGVIERITSSTEEHRRALMTTDELARMSDDACLLITKGCAPVQALKLDATPPPIPVMLQRAKPVVKRAALATAACLVVGMLTTWALWPAAKLPPSLALTTPREAGETEAAKPAEGMTADPSTRQSWLAPTPTTPSDLWELWYDSRGPGILPVHRITSRHQTAEACDQSRQAELARLESQYLLNPTVKRLPDGTGYTTVITKSIQKTETWSCSLKSSLQANPWRRPS